MPTTIDATAVLGRAFAIYREYAVPLLTAALAVFLVTGVVAFVFDSGILVLVATIVALVADIFYKGMVVRLVDDVRDGSLDASVGQLFQSVAPVAFTLFLAGLVAGIGIGIGLILVIVPGLFLMTIWAVVAPVVVLEQRGVFDALSRSRELVRGNGWGVFGLIVILFVLQFGVGILAGTIGAIGGDVVRALLQLIVTVLLAPLTALAVSVLYFELRGPDAAVAPAPPAGL